MTRRARGSRGGCGSYSVAGRTAGSVPLAFCSSSSSIFPVENSIRPNERSSVARGSPTSYATDVSFSSASRARHPSGQRPGATRPRRRAAGRRLPNVSRQPSLALCGPAATLASAGRPRLAAASRPRRRRSRRARLRVPRVSGSSSGSPRQCSHTGSSAPVGRGPGTLARALDLYEFQGKELFRRFGIPVSEGRLATTRRGGGRGREGARRPGRRQGAGADRGTRQGGGHQARGHARGGRGARRRDPRHGHPRARGREGLDRARVGHRARVLPLDHLRPRREEAALHVHDAGRRRHRGGRCVEPGRARPAPRRPARGVPPVARAAARLRGGRRGSRGAEADRRDRGEALRGVRRLRGDALRDQPADRDDRTARCARSTRSSPSTTTRSSGTRTSPRCATSAPPTRWRRWRARRASRT